MTKNAPDQPIKPPANSNLIGVVRRDTKRPIQRPSTPTQSTTVVKKDKT